MEDKKWKKKYLKKVEGSRRFDKNDMNRITRVCQELWEEIDHDESAQYLNLYEAAETVGWTLSAHYEGLTEIEKKLFLKGIKEGFKNFKPYR